MLHVPRVLKMGGFALVALALVGALTVPMMATAQGPTSTPTTSVGGATAEATTEATTEATQAAEPTRLPPCPLPDGVAAQTASATEAPGDLATTAATEAATADSTAAATEPPLFEPGYLGIAGEDVDTCGTKVVDVLPDSPAQVAGVQVDDVVVGVGMTGYPGVLALREYITTQPIGAELELVVRRNGEEVILPVTLGARPSVIPPTVTPAN
jgi:predicted metalloprotease with PDZ domain